MTLKSYGVLAAAVFLAFQSQVWHTDDLQGHALLDPAGPRVRGVAHTADHASPDGRTLTSR